MLAAMSSALAGDLYGGPAFRLPAGPSGVGFAGDGLAALTVTDRIAAVSLPGGTVGTARPACAYPSHFSPHGDRVAMTCDYARLVMLSWPALAPIASVPWEDGELVWSADGSGLALVRSQGITFFDRSLRRTGAVGLGAHRVVGRGADWFLAGPVGEDGGEGVVAVRPDGTRRWFAPGWSGALALSGDGRRLLVGREGAVEWVDPATGEVALAVARPDDTPYEGAWTAAGWWVSARRGFERLDDRGGVLGAVAASSIAAVSPDGALVIVDPYEPVLRVRRADGTALGDEPLEGGARVVAGRRGEVFVLAGDGRVVELGPGGAAAVRATIPEASDLDAGPNGELVVVAGGAVHLVDRSGRERVVPRFTGEDEWLRAARFAPDGRVLALGDRAFWSVSAGVVGQRVEAGLGDFELARVGAGRIALASEYSVTVVDVATGRTLLHGGDGEPWGLGLRPDGSVVVGSEREGYDGDAVLVGTLPGPEAAPWDLCCALAVAPDGRFVAEGRDDRIRAFDPAGRAELGSWTLSGPLRSLWSPAPDTLVAELLDGRLEVVDASRLPAPKVSSPPAANLPPAALVPAVGDRLDGAVGALSWTAAGRLLRSAAYVVDEVDPRTGAVRERLHPYGSLRAAPQGDGLVVLSREDDPAVLRRLGPGGDPVWQVTPKAAYELAVGGGIVAVGDTRRFEVRDAGTGALRWSGPEGAGAAVISADGSRLAARGVTGVTVFRDDGTKGRTIAVAACEAALSPDGSRLAVADRTGRVWLFAATGDGPGVALDGIGACPGLAFSPDGATLATRHDRELLLWDAASGTALRGWTMGDGRLVAWGPALATADGASVLLLHP